MKNMDLQTKVAEELSYMVGVMASMGATSKQALHHVRRQGELIEELFSQHEIEVRGELKKKVAKMKDSHSHGAIYQQGLDDAFNEVLALLEDK